MLAGCSLFSMGNPVPTPSIDNVVKPATIDSNVLATVMPTGKTLVDLPREERAEVLKLQQEAARIDTFNSVQYAIAGLSFLLVVAGIAVAFVTSKWYFIAIGLLSGALGMIWFPASSYVQDHQWTFVVIIAAPSLLLLSVIVLYVVKMVKLIKAAIQEDMPVTERSLFSPEPKPTAKQMLAKHCGIR
jgi:hypothetical protein